MPHEPNPDPSDEPARRSEPSGSGGQSGLPDRVPDYVDEHADEHGDSHSHRGDHDAPAPSSSGLPLRIGIGGPVGSGKTALVAEVCRALSDRVSLGVVTNDIYTTEDADFLRRAGVLDDSRIIAVETGCCPHTAIRDDITANLAAIDELLAATPDLELVVIESGGDNLTATFSSGLVDRQIFVLDVAGGDKVPRKGGPGVIRSDLLVINKVDLAPMVGADLVVMEDDAVRVRSGGPVALISLRTGDGFGGILSWLSAWIESARPVRGSSGVPGTRPDPGIPGARTPAAVSNTEA